jgi:hypothetical protein
MEQAGWHGLDQIYREFPLRAGRVSVRGNKAHRDQSTVLRADYSLFFKANIPIAVVEAKDNNKPMGSGMAQAINYADLLGVPFCFASNGDGFAVISEAIDEAYVSQHVALVRLYDNRLVDHLHLWLVSEHEGRKRLLMSSYGAKPGLNLQNINELLVPLPSLAEQSRIVTRVNELHALCAELRVRLTASQLTQSHLADAMVVQ